MGIRLKITAGFVILASLLVISGLISIYELTKLGQSVNRLLHDNYRSIDYSREMSASLEKQRRALVMAVNGDTEGANALFTEAKGEFEEAIRRAANNLTILGEINSVDSLAQAFSDYAPVALGFINNGNQGVSLYLNELQPRVWAIQGRVDNLLTVNQQILNQTANLLEKSPYRTILPGLLVVITSIIFSIIFSYMISYYMLNPIIRITKGINDFVRFKKPFDVNIETKDEMHDLKEAVKDLATMRSLHKN